MKMYIARDGDGGLYLYPEEPTKDAIYKNWTSYNWIALELDLFPEVTFENSPMEVELKLVNNDKNVSNEEQEKLQTHSSLYKA